jgi:hypothetical protein
MIHIDVFDAKGLPMTTYTAEELEAGGPPLAELLAATAAVAAVEAEISENCEAINIARKSVGAAKATILATAPTIDRVNLSKAEAAFQRAERVA